MNVPVDIVLRGVGLGFGIALLLGLGLRGGWRRQGPMLWVLACACAYLACSTPARPCCATPLALPLLAGAIGFPFAFWRLARLVLADDRDVPVLAWIAGAALLAGGLVAAAEYVEVGTRARMAGAVVNKLAAFGLVGAALFDTWRSWDGDLVEPRRRLRWALLAYVGTYGVVILVGEVFLLGDAPPPWVDLANVGMISLTLLATLVLLLRPDASAMEALFAPSRDEAAPGPVLRDRACADDALLARLRNAMETERLYRDADLSVATLAGRCGVPEYVLRRAIHRHLGHRNFASYVNAYRLGEVADRLRDPQLARRPVLTLALEAGFGSIGPFNRAFKARYGLTPTEFRAGSATVATEVS